MKVLLGAFGTRGDVQPVLALGQELRARGHALVLAVPPSSVALARSFGFDARPLGLDFEELSRRAATGTLREMLALLPLVRGQVAVQLEALEAEAEQADVIVGSSVFCVGGLLADRFRTPYVFLSFAPQMLPSSEHPAPSTPWQTLPRFINRLSWTPFQWLWNRVLRGPVNAIRRARGLTPIRDAWTTLLGATPMLACDPALAPVPADVRLSVTQVGALFAEETGELTPETRAFLDAGAPPVYIGFGSMSDPDPKQTTARLLASVRQAGVRAVISRGWAGLGTEQAPEGVLFVGSEPHGRLFARCAAVVHHGGAGTTHAAARAGVPQVVMPQLLDQHYWAHRVASAGIAARSVPRHARDPELLAASLRQCLEDEALRSRASALGDGMIGDGVRRAADHLEVLAASSARRVA